MAKVVAMKSPAGGSSTVMVPENSVATMENRGWTVAAPKVSAKPKVKLKPATEETKDG
jgi:hypothetical protein